MSGLSARGFSPCSPDFRYSRRSARFRRPSRRRSKGCRPAEPEPTQAAPPSPTGAPPTPASPFGLSPETFPGIVGGRPPPAAAPPFGAPAPPESPFGLSPDIFPGILGGRPDRRTLEQPALPSSEPGISPGISPGTSPGAPSGVPTAPAAAPSEAAPESGAGGASRRTAAGSCHDTGPHPAVRDAALWVRQFRRPLLPPSPGSGLRRRQAYRSRRDGACAVASRQRFRFRPMIFALPPILFGRLSRYSAGYTDNPPTRRRGYSHAERVWTNAGERRDLGRYRAVARTTERGAGLP